MGGWSPFCGKICKAEIDLKVFVYDDKGRSEYKATVFAEKVGKNGRRYFLRSRNHGVQLNGESMIIGKTNLITHQIIRHLQNKAPKQNDPAMNAFIFGHFGE